MKTLVTSAIALCLLVLVGCAEGNAPAPDATITDATNKVEANITGMDCTGCSSSVAAAVKGIDGVKDCYADVKSGNVTVALADDADAEAKMLEVEKVIAGLSDGKYAIKTITVSTGDTAAKSCPVGCTKECCTKADGDEAKTCPVGCTKECCTKEKVDEVVETVKDEVKEVTKDIEIPSFGGE
jgi:Cu+-exporting ATPase